MLDRSQNRENCEGPASDIMTDDEVLHTIHFSSSSFDGSPRISHVANRLIGRSPRPRPYNMRHTYATAILMAYMLQPFVRSSLGIASSYYCVHIRNGWTGTEHGVVAPLELASVPGTIQMKNTTRK
jgi:hypothetical protein